MPGSLVGGEDGFAVSTVKQLAGKRPGFGLGASSRPVLFVAFAFAVMADPVSSVAYTIEASLRALHGHLGLLLVTQIIVLAIIALVDVNYWQLVGRFPLGGGSAEAAARAFGTGWVFLPIGALIVDFVLTIAISVAAAGSAVIAYVPALAPTRIALGLLLLVAVAGLTWFGHGGRLIFAAMTLLFVASAVVMLVHGFTQPVTDRGHAPVTGPSGPAVLAVLLSFPVAMALATGTEAPSTAIGQLGQLDAADRRRFARGTLALTLVIVAGLTIAITALAVRLHVGIPAADSTQIADVARGAAGGGPVYALFQATSALLLLAAASSSFQAGPGLLKALSRHPASAGVGILPRLLGTANRHHTPYWSVVVYLAVSGVVLLAAGGHEQELVLVYAVAVFVSFLAGLGAMTRFSLREGRRGLALVNAAGAVAVAFTLGVNLARGYPLLSLAAMLVIAGSLYAAWVRQGRPTGVEQVEQLAEADC
ncbi:MAG: amino acid permease [Gaiellales bacterium]